MKRTISFLLCLAAFLFLRPVGACAESLPEKTAESFGISALTEGLDTKQREITGEAPMQGVYNAEGAIGRFWQSAKLEMADQLKRQLSFVLQLSALSLLCALSDAMTESRSARETISLAACCTAAAILAGDWDSGINQSIELLEKLSDYSRSALPLVYTAAAAAGAPGSATLKYAAACFAVEVLMTVSNKLILPIILAYLALALCACVCENCLVSAMQRVLKFCAVNLMSIMTAGFCAYISLTGLVAGSTDAAAVKAARTVLSSVLPVVGGILSDSAAAILAAAAAVRNTAGVFAVIAVCSLSLGPFLFLFLKMLLLRAVAVLAEILPGGRLARLLDEFASVFGMLLGLVGCGTIMLLFSLAAGMKAVTGL